MTGPSRDSAPAEAGAGQVLVRRLDSTALGELAARTRSVAGVLRAASRDDEWRTPEVLRAVARLANGTAIRSARLLELAEVGS